MYQLKNSVMEVEINPHGAELVRVVKDGHDYLWDADPAFWGRTSPVLFPIVGSLANGKYFVDGKEFTLGQHGFARDMELELLSQSDDELWFELKSSSETRLKYPFDFTLKIGYCMVENALEVKWEVVNDSQATMPFSIGAHPAFLAGPDLSDYTLYFNNQKPLETLIFDNEHGLIKIDDPKKAIDSPLKLTKALFEEFPVLIFEDVSEIKLGSATHARNVVVSFDHFPYVGIWSPINKSGEVAPFVCIEPWYGLADTKMESGELADKFAIQKLAPKQGFTASYVMKFN